jgi:hypothetical protein
MPTTRVPAFYVPGCKTEHQEALYAALAAFAKVPAPAPEARIYETTFDDDGKSEVWTARVGSKLEGHVVQRSRTGEEKRRTPVDDAATVLAIFPVNSTTLVVTNRPASITQRFSLAGCAHSRFSNPFFGGDAGSVRFFSASA